MNKRILKMEVKMEDGKKKVIFFPVVIEDGIGSELNKSLLSKKKEKAGPFSLKKSRMIN